MSNTTINPTGLVNYIQSYYDKIIYSQLQANYGRVFIDMGLDTNNTTNSINTASNIPYSQALFEKKLKERRDKVSFDGFIQKVTNSSVIDHGTNTDNNTNSPNNTPLNFATSIIDPNLASQQPQSSSESPEEPQELSLVPISLLPGLGAQAGAQNGAMNDAQKYKGKSLRLGRKVDFNDVIFAERPMSSLNIEPEYAQSCDYCLRPITSLQEQVWSMLIAGDKTPKSTNAKDIIALLDQFAPFNDVVNEYIYLSSVGDDDEEEDYKEAIKEGKLTKDEYEILKEKLNQYYLADNKRDALIDFYNTTVLRPYNYIMRDLHQREKEMVGSGTATSTTTTSFSTVNLSPQDQKDSQSIAEVQRAMYDLLEETDEKTILDINELKELSIFEPSTRFAEVQTPVYTPYSANMYCSVRCMCVAYNNYEHILAHAYPRVDARRFEGFLDDEEDEMKNSIQEDRDEINEEEEDDDDAEVEMKLPPKQSAKKDVNKTFPLKSVPHSPIINNTTITDTTNPPQTTPGMLTTSLTTIPGPSGLPFLQQSSLYSDLITFTRGANPMFLQHIRGITQSLSYWGLKLVEILGGDYNDIIALLTLQGEYLSVQNTAVAKDLVNYTDMIVVHNDYLVKHHKPEAVVSLHPQKSDSSETSSQNDIVQAEERINTRLGEIVVTLEEKFGSNISKLRDQHAKFYSQRITALTSPDPKGTEDPFNSASSDDNTIELFPMDPSKNSAMLKCFCTECLFEASFSLLQYSIFPYLLFTQSQWFTHVHDGNGDNLFSFMDKNPAEKALLKTIMSLNDHQQVAANNTNNNTNNNNNTQSSAHDDASITTHHASLFRHQIDLLQELQDHFQPIIEGYARVMSVYCSLITPLYQQCLKKLSTKQQLFNALTPESTSTQPIILQSPFFIDILFPTIAVDETMTIPIPYSAQNVKEVMNDIPERIANFANAIQRPVDCCNWLVLSQFVSICEMNNIQIAPKSGVMDMIEFFTVDNILDLDPEDVEEVEEKMTLMYQAAVNIHLKSLAANSATGLDIRSVKVSELSQEIKATFPPHLANQDAYIEYVLKFCGNLMKKKAPVASKKTQQATTNDPIATSLQETGDYTKAWALLNKRVDGYPDCSGLFRVACTMNHSCDPNCTAIPLGDGRSNLIAIVALRDINPGEELTISYIDEGINSYSKRQAELKDYQFICGCKRCIKDKQKAAAVPAKKKPVGVTVAKPTATAGGPKTTPTVTIKPSPGKSAAGGAKTASKSAASGPSKKK